MRGVAVLVMLAGCGGLGNDWAKDLELGVPPDMSPGADLPPFVWPDIGPATDLTPVPDIDSPPDMVQPDDLMTPPLPDLAQSDLTVCGGAQQPCCGNNTCTVGTCMRQTSTGDLRCINAGGCGGYLTACCTVTGGTTMSIAGFCVKDPNAPGNGNNLGWYRCFSNGCRP